MRILFYILLKYHHYHPTPLAIKKKPLWIHTSKRPCNIILLIFIHHWDSTPPGCCFCWDSSEWTMHIYTHDPLNKNNSPSLLLSRAVESSVTVVVDPSPTPCQSLATDWVGWFLNPLSLWIQGSRNNWSTTRCNYKWMRRKTMTSIPSFLHSCNARDHPWWRVRAKRERAALVEHGAWIRPGSLPRVCVCLYFCMLDWFLRVKCIMAQSQW